MASLFKVKALYDFEAKEEDDLGFPVGQIIDVTEVVDDSWLEGKYTDTAGATQAGIFPRDFVEKYEPPMPTRPTRPARTKVDAVPVPVAVPEPEPVAEPEEPESEEDVAPPLPAVSKPQLPPREAEEMRSAISASQPAPPARSESKPAPAEPASAKKPPPPIAAKSNAFRDRIAAFNQPAAAPVAPMVPGGGKSQGHTFIKKPFVAPPPLANSYVPPPKVETVHKPYIREEDPEIKRRREEDHAAAEAAGLTSDPEQQEEGEDAPKPTTLKERIALLQQQQMEQAQRRADGGAEKREKKPPVKKASQSSEQAEARGEAEELEQVTSPEPVAGRQSLDRQSLDLPRERPRVPSTQLDETPLSPIVAAPEHEPVSENDADQSNAEETTEDDAGTIGPDDSDERQAPLPPPRVNTIPKQQADVGDEQDPEEDEEQEDSMDEETRRRLELRERMAKMSGGMGMAGMFGPPGAMPLPGGAAQKKKTTKPRQASGDNEKTSPPLPPQRIPMPGFSRTESSEAGRKSLERSERGLEEDQPMPPPRKSLTEDRAAAPPVPKGSRPSLDAGSPPPVPTSGLPTPRTTAPDARPVPPPPAAPMSPGPGYQSDDEMSVHQQREPLESPNVLTPGPSTRSSIGMAPPVPGFASENKSYFANEPTSATSDRRASRAPPPVPGSPLNAPRPPPPPPPADAGRSPVPEYTDETEGHGESEYEGDYDTDIASGVKHKDALKSQHTREMSLDDSITAENSPSQHQQPPQTSAPRAVPPPPPQLPTRTRQSADLPRAPPPLPPGAQQSVADHDDEYDPFRYENRRAAPPPAPVPVPVTAPSLPPPVPSREADEGQDSSADEMYSTTPPRRSVERPPPQPPQERAVPAPPSAQAPSSQPAPPPQRAPPRESLDIRRSDTTGRRSMESRSAEGNGQIATDVPLPSDTPWWTAPQPLPPALQARNGVDILSECEESTTSKRGGITYISKDIYVLYMDYSQTIITARFDSRNPADISLEQRHLPPPSKLRQDQLESYWQRFGRAIAEAASSLGNTRKDSTVGDGSPFALVSSLIAAHPKALQPVGTRAYGSLIYANLANASTVQFDEIRAGDIVTLRNARFEGAHGAMKHKYKADYGVQHVAVVEEWDGTKRAIRGWEQGRDGEKKKGVRSEKFRLGDLKSGEVRVWRVVGRGWVEWEVEE